LKIFLLQEATRWINVLLSGKNQTRPNNGCDTDNDNFENPFYDNASVINSLDDPVSQFLEIFPRSENGSARDNAKMFLPSLVIHMVPQQRLDVCLNQEFLSIGKTN